MIYVLTGGETPIQCDRASDDEEWIHDGSRTVHIPALSQHLPDGVASFHSHLSKITYWL